MDTRPEARLDLTCLYWTSTRQGDPSRRPIYSVSSGSTSWCRGERYPRCPKSLVRRARFLYATRRHLLFDGCDSTANRRGLDEFENGCHCFDKGARRCIEEGARHCFRRGGCRGTGCTAWGARATSPRPHRPPSEQERPIKRHAHAHSRQIQFAPSHAIAVEPQ